MPSPEQYADAIRGITGIASVLDDPRQTDARAVYSLALRWLRVGAAMEAGTIRLFPPVEKPGLWLARNDAMNRSHYLSDPLTAAERAMGVGM